jgi:hypothetical protein
VIDSGYRGGNIINLNQTSTITTNQPSSFFYVEPLIYNETLWIAQIINNNANTISNF